LPSTAKIVHPKKFLRIGSAPGLLSLTEEQTERQMDITTALHVASLAYIGGGWRKQK